jgi:hypothetical protein
MKTKQIPAFASIAIGVLALLPSGAFAATIAWDNNYRTGNGGEFTLVGTGFDLSGYAVTTSNIVSSGSFQTFCIEMNEYITNGLSVTATVNPLGAVNGGAGGPNPDPISHGTSFLYSEFARGILPGYTYTPGSLPGVDAREISAGQLQNAIWYLEDEQDLASAGGFGVGGNPFLNYAASSLGLTLADLKLDALSPQVQAVNLTSGPNGRTLNQDQLYYSPPEQNVPEGGASLALLGLVLAGLGACRRLIAVRA